MNNCAGIFILVYTLDRCTVYTSYIHNIRGYRRLTHVISDNYCSKSSLKYFQRSLFSIVTLQFFSDVLYIRLSSQRKRQSQTKTDWKSDKCTDTHKQPKTSSDAAMGQRIRRQTMIDRRQAAGRWLVLIIDKDHTIPQMIKLSWLPRVLWCVTDPWLSSTTTGPIRSAFSSMLMHIDAFRPTEWETKKCQ